MTLADRRPSGRPSGAVRRFAVHHPAAAVLVPMFAVSYGLLIPAVLSGVAPEPFLVAAVLLGQLLPAVLVTAAAGGRPAVRALFGRVFRWRVHVGWYLLALLAVPGEPCSGAPSSRGLACCGPWSATPRWSWATWPR
jgi:hypothetical protein